MLETIALGRIAGINESRKLGLLNKDQALHQIGHVLKSYQQDVNNDLDRMHAAFNETPALASR